MPRTQDTLRGARSSAPLCRERGHWDVTMLHSQTCPVRRNLLACILPAVSLPVRCPGSHRERPSLHRGQEPPASPPAMGTRSPMAEETSQKGASVAWGRTGLFGLRRGVFGVTMSKTENQ